MICHIVEMKTSHHILNENFFAICFHLCNQGKDLENEIVVSSGRRKIVNCHIVQISLDKYQACCLCQNGTFIYHTNKYHYFVYLNHESDETEPSFFS